ncbi:hypothetical protein SESBI_36893 [Sesbania bispinosa]|nr:hypothetical protein SESBI_36893 [Sesbania bispinosa]
MDMQERTRSREHVIDFHSTRGSELRTKLTSRSTQGVVEEKEWRWKTLRWMKIFFFFLRIKP